MSMRKIASVVILILCMSLTSCSKTALSDEEKCSVVSEIAEACLEQYSKGSCEKEKDIKIEQILRWSAPDSKIREASKKDENVKYYYAVWNCQFEFSHKTH